MATDIMVNTSSPLVENAQEGTFIPPEHSQVDSQGSIGSSQENNTVTCFVCGTINTRKRTKQLKSATAMHI